MRRLEALSACADVVSPLVPLLLQLGVSAGEFAALCRAVFVHVARKELSKRSRRVSQSAIAIVTGLTRAEVKKMLSQPVVSFTEKDWERQRTARVIEGWRSDPQFCSRNGKPKDLNVKGRVGSFKALVQKYSGDIPVRAMLDELSAMAAIRRQRDGKIRLNSRSPTTPFDKGSMRAFGQRSANILATLVHNVRARSDRLFEGSVSENVDQELVPVFKKRIAIQGQNFLELVEDQLSHPPTRSRNGGNRAKRRTRVGVTLILHQGDAGLGLGSKQT